MRAEVIFDAPIASVRTFGIVMPAIVDEDPEGAKAALQFAKKLATELMPWETFPYQGRDTAFLKVARMLRDRDAEDKLTSWDIRLLADLCVKAVPMGPYASLDDKNDPYVSVFNTACEIVEESWRDDQSRV